MRRRRIRMNLSPGRTVESSTMARRMRNDESASDASRFRSKRERALIAALLAGVLLAGPALAGPPPPPPPGYGAPQPSVSRMPPPPVYVPAPVAGAPPVVQSGPPPLPIAMRVIYAPFYVAGLIVRYSVYYVLVAPFEVLFRTIDYGSSGGIDPNLDPYQGP